MFLNYYDICKLGHKTKKAEKLKYERIPLLANKIRAILKPEMSYLIYLIHLHVFDLIYLLYSLPN